MTWDAIGAIGEVVGALAVVLLRALEGLALRLGFAGLLGVVLQHQGELFVVNEATTVRVVKSNQLIHINGKLKIVTYSLQLCSGYRASLVCVATEALKSLVGRSVSKWVV